MNREERLKYFRAGIKEGYKLAIRRMREGVDEMEEEGTERYGNTFTDIQIHLPNEEEV